MRSMVVVLTVVVVIYVADFLDKVLAVIGAIFGMVNVLILPSLCHYNLVAETRG